MPSDCHPSLHKYFGWQKFMNCLLLGLFKHFYRSKLFLIISKGAYCGFTYSNKLYRSVSSAFDFWKPLFSLQRYIRKPRISKSVVMLACKNKMGLQLYDEDNDSRLCYVRIHYFNRNLAKLFKWSYKRRRLLPKLANYFCRSVLFFTKSTRKL